MTDVKWFELAISTLFSAIVSLIIGFIYHWIQRKTANTAEKERRKQAHSEMLDIVEDYIVNKIDISVEFITALVSAIEREYGIVWADEAITTTLLQDVALRLQKSKHLDVHQKNEYMAYCHLQISTLRIENEKTSSTSLNQLEQSIQTNDTKKSINDIKLMQEKIIGLMIIIFFITLYQMTKGFNLTVTIIGIGSLVGVLASILNESGRNELAYLVEMVGLVTVSYLLYPYISRIISL